MKIFFTKILILICWLSTIYEADAQILPPDFLCVSGDSLFFEPANNTCGAFVSYDIYVADNVDGPFMLLAEVTDPVQLFYKHPNPSDLTFFYYLESNHNCPGVLRLQSDTLDNRVPADADIETVTVVVNDVLISWLPNSSPETAGYFIYRETPIGTIPIDTVYNSLSYLDVTADPKNKSETYFILAFDPCWNQSIFTNPHRTMYLDATTAECEQRIDLEWNPYLSWSGGVEKQEIWIGKAGDVPQLVETIGGLDSTYSIENAIDGCDYCVFVRAIADSTSVVSQTNEVCITPAIVNPIRELLVKNLDVQPDGSVEVTWLWNTDARLNSADLEVSLEGDAAVNSTPISFSFPLSRENQMIHSAPNGHDGQLNFNLRTVDDCDTIKISARANPIFLSVNANGLTNELTWTPLQIDSVEVEFYDVFKIENGTANNIGQTDANTFEFNDILSEDAIAGEALCYFVRASSIFTFPDGRTQQIRSKSNEACQAQAVKIWMPNAFAPRGRNQIFKPVLAFGVPKTYKMMIFNRWGEMLFQSEKIEDGWNGKIGIQDAPSGVYTYLVQISGQDGSAESFSGSVMLVR